MLSCKHGKKTVQTHGITHDIYNAKDKTPGLHKEIYARHSSNNTKSSAHFVGLGGIERVARVCKLLRHNVAQIHQTIQTLLEGFDRIRRIWSVSCFPLHNTRQRSVDSP